MTGVKRVQETCSAFKLLRQLQLWAQWVSLFISRRGKSLIYSVESTQWCVITDSVVTVKVWTIFHVESHSLNESAVQTSTIPPDDKLYAVRRAQFPCCYPPLRLIVNSKQVGASCSCAVSQCVWWNPASADAPETCSGRFLKFSSVKFVNESPALSYSAS